MTEIQHDYRGNNLLEVYALDTLPEEEKLFLVFRDGAIGTRNSRFFNHPKKEPLKIPKDLLEFVYEEEKYIRYSAIGKYYLYYQIFCKDGIKTKYTYNKNNELIETSIIN